MIPLMKAIESVDFQIVNQKEIEIQIEVDEKLEQSIGVSDVKFLIVIDSVRNHFASKVLRKNEKYSLRVSYDLR